MKMKIEAFLLILAALQTLCSPQSPCRDDSISSSPRRVGNISSSPRRLGRISSGPCRVGSISSSPCRIGSISSSPRRVRIICSQDHRVAAVQRQVYPLDMALNSADDQFDGCRDEMAIKVEKEYLKNEKNSNLNFRTAWEVAEKRVKPSPGNLLNRTHLIAIYVYTDRIVYADFNNAVRSGKPTYENGTYQWYSLHFLLTDAVQILKTGQKKCYDTFRGTKVNINDQNVLNTEVRLGSFVSSSLDRNKTKPFGNKSCFEIRTCKGADISKYSKLPSEKEVLIPPYETFKVTKVQKKTENKDLWCETVFTLESHNTKSDLNCTVVKNLSWGAFPIQQRNPRLEYYRRAMRRLAKKQYSDNPNLSY